MFEGDYKLVHHLAPPLIGRQEREGRAGQAALRPLDAHRLRLLAKPEGPARHGALDIFGKTEERRPSAR
jgi:indolepyruvate ferredoxin oxidoreductase